MLSEKSPLNGAYGSVLGLEHGMGFIVFLKEGRLAVIEGYCNSNGPTTGIDFSRAVFGLMPWVSRQTHVVDRLGHRPEVQHVGTLSPDGRISFTAASPSSPTHTG